ncbi:glycosyltransferase family 4 protein [Micromonospora sp. DT46]|uniref:glycosyltransferase family 4 protein n=1 Tax=Micromonospora sp. DT46 TaxID=3393435 RepID=UPI003CF25663
MRILLVAEKYPPIVGGGETHVHQLAEGLVKLGHEVTVVTEAVQPSAEWSAYRSSKVRVREVSGLMAACQRLECRDAVAQLHAELTASEADVVHVFNYVPALLTSWLRPMVKAKLAVSLFETFVPGVRVFDMWDNYPLERMLQRGLVDSLRPDLHICGSQAYLRWAREAGFTEPAEVVEFGTDLRAFAPDPRRRARWRAERGLTDEFAFLVPARPVPRKRIEDAIAALAELAAEYPAMRLVLTCPTARTNSAYLQRLRALAERLGVADRVRWETGLSWQDMPALYAGCDAMVLPSSHEGWGIALTEAMTCRLPVITTDVEGHDEVVTDERTGLLYEAGNIAHLAAAMRRVMTTDVGEMVEQAAREATRRFSIDAVVRGHERAYLAMLSDGSAGGADRVKGGAA